MTEYQRRALHRVIFGAAALTLLWAALAPLGGGSREHSVAIPAGTAALLASGGRDDSLPEQITLTLGVDDVLLLRNADRVPSNSAPC